MKINLGKRKIGYVHGSVSGRFSFRGEKTVCFESRLEKDFLTVMAFDDRVLDVEEQPFTLEYRTGEGKEARYTPDFLVTWKMYGYGKDPGIDPPPMVVEVKPREILRKRYREFRERFRAMYRYCRKEGMTFRIFDESRIHTGYFRNVRLLERYRRYAYDPGDEERILALVEGAGHIRIDALLAVLGGDEMKRAENLGHVRHLLAVKKLAADLSEPLTQRTLVWLHESLFEGGSS